MCTTTLEASYVHCMKMTASLTSLNVSGMEMMGELNILFDVALVCILFYLKIVVRFLVVSAGQLQQEL